MKSILRHPLKTELCCPAQCNVPTGVYKHRGDHGPPQCSCWFTRTISPFFALIMHIPTTVHLGQPQNLLPKSGTGGRQNTMLLDLHLLPCSPTAQGGWERLGWSFTPASPICNTELDCSTRNKCYSHPTKEGSWSMTKARVAGGRAAGRPVRLRWGHSWGLSSLQSEALLSGVTK